MMNISERGGRVVGFDGGQALVRLEASSGCGGCGSRGTCASGGNAAQVIRMDLPAGTEPGDRVTLSLPSSSVALAALLGYLLPPAGLLVGAVGAATRYEGDAAAVLGAGLGLVAGLLLARLISRFAFGRGLDAAVCRPDSHPGEHP